MNFAFPANQSVKLKESEKRLMYLDLARELKKTMAKESDCNWSIVTDALGTVTKVLVEGLEDLEIRGRVETIQTAGLLR